MASTGSDGSAQVTDMIVSWFYLYIIYFSFILLASPWFVYFFWWG